MLKFKRGKRRDNGEWIVGFYMEVKHHDDDCHVHAFILLPGKCVDNVEYLDFMVEVFPECVGDEAGAKFPEEERAAVCEDYDNEKATQIALLKNV